MIGVVDYEAGNLTSVANALSTVQCEFIVSSDVETLSHCNGIILPGVGAAPGAMLSLHRRGLTTFLQSLDVPFLGICLGMQLLYSESEEGKTTCLGIVPGTISQLDPDKSKVPHMGWNTVRVISPNLLTDGMSGEQYFYFAHSFVAGVNGVTTAVADCGVPFAAVIRHKNYFGVQFHPEKSGDAGLRLLKNFDTTCTSYRQ
jgi:glutamine amidotransferase